MSQPSHNVEVGGAQAAYRLLDVLSGLAMYPGGVGLTDLSTSLDLPTSTVRRLLRVLLDRGFAEQDDATRTYRLGPETRILGGRHVDDQVLRGVAREILLELRRESTETVFCSIRDGLEVVYVECLAAIHPVKMYGEPGTRLPLHATSQGKVILAFLPSFMTERLLRKLSFESFTQNTITDIASLQSELEVIRRRGYALNLQERELGVLSVAAPVLDPSGQAVAAVCIGAPTLRVSEDDLVSRLAPMVMRAGWDLSKALFPLSQAVNRIKGEKAQGMRA